HLPSLHLSLLELVLDFAHVRPDLFILRPSAPGREVALIVMCVERLLFPVLDAAIEAFFMGLRIGRLDAKPRDLKAEVVERIGVPLACVPLFEVGCEHEERVVLVVEERIHELLERVVALLLTYRHDQKPSRMMAAISLNESFRSSLSRLK